jgi:hypothetical protein
MFCPSFSSPAVTEEGKKVFFDDTELVSRIWPGAIKRARCSEHSRGIG